MGTLGNGFVPHTVREVMNVFVKECTKCHVHIKKRKKKADVDKKKNSDDEGRPGVTAMDQHAQGKCAIFIPQTHTRASESEEWPKGALAAEFAVHMDKSICVYW